MTTRKTLDHLKKMSSLWPFLKPYKLQILMVFLALTLAALTVLSIGLGLRYVIDEALSTKDTSSLRFFFFLFIIITLLLAAASYSRFYFIAKISEDVTADVRKFIFQKLIYARPALFEKLPTTQIISRLTTDMTIIQTVIGSSGSMALRNVILLMGSTSMLFYTNPLLTSFVFLAIPILIIPIIIVGKKVKTSSRTEQDKLTTTSTFLDEALKAIHTVQAFNQEHRCLSEFSQYVDNTKQAAITRIQKRAFLTAMVISLVFMAIGLLLLFGGYQVINNNMSGGELSEFVFYAVLVASSTGSLSEVFGALQRAAGSLQRVEDLLTLNTEFIYKSQQNTSSLPENIVNNGFSDNSFTGRIKFENVSFSYPTKRKLPTLKNLSFEIQPGHMVALVGSSGAGKSTIFQLLLRFYDPDKGSIFFDEMNISNLDETTSRLPFAYVPQDPMIFSSDLYSNITFGNPKATPDEVEQAMTLAALDEFVTDLPEGLKTDLGQKGIQISSGQKQRIALARAFLTRPKVLLLDEATNALDAHNEKIIYQALQAFKKQGTTVIVITHKLTTISHADQILVLDKGCLKGDGSHKELQKNCHFYKKTLKLFSQEENKNPKK